MGGKTSFCEAKAAEIVRRLAAGEVMRVICAGEGMPAPRTVNDWCKANEAFKADFDAAMLAGCHALLDETIEIADDLTDDPASRKVRIWARHELAKRKRPDVFSEKHQLEHTGAGGKDLPIPQFIIQPVSARQEG